jgi:hypothetical protein
MPVQKEQQDSALEISARLANIEALLRQLLERRQLNERTNMKRASSLRERLRNEAERKPVQPSDRHFRMVRELKARATTRR